MKRKYRIRKKAENEYSAITGVEAFQMDGGSGCLIVKYSSKSGGKTATRFAYEVYSEEHDLNKNIKVLNSCGVLNCVLKDHLVVSYEPSKADLEYIRDYLKIDGPEFIAQKLGVPLEIFHRFINSVDNK